MRLALDSDGPEILHQYVKQQRTKLSFTSPVNWRQLHVVKKMFIKKSGKPTDLKGKKNIREISVATCGTVSKAAQSRWETMNRLWDTAFQALKDAHEDGLKFLVIKHGKSPNKRGQVSIGSQVRTLVRSHAAGPYILRSKCIQYESAFVVAIRPKS